MMAGGASSPEAERDAELASAAAMEVSAEIAEIEVDIPSGPLAMSSRVIIYPRQPGLEQILTISACIRPVLLLARSSVMM